MTGHITQPGGNSAGILTDQHGSTHMVRSRHRQSGKILTLALTTGNQHNLAGNRRADTGQCCQRRANIGSLGIVEPLNTAGLRHQHTTMR